jgi:hypothetical protein
MGKKLTQDEFIAKSIASHKVDEYTYELARYVNQRTSVWITCKVHGQFEQGAGAHMAGQGCPLCWNAKFTGRDEVDHTGEVYGKLKVLKEYSIKTEAGKIVRHFDCLCSCGEYHTARKFSVLRGVTKSCGCDRYDVYDEKYDRAKIGDKFSILTVLTAPIRTPNGRLADFRCDCGTVKSILVHNVLNGATKSCGCYIAAKKIGNTYSTKLSRDVWPSVCERYAQGETGVQIAASYGVDDDTVYRALELSGVSRRAKEDICLHYEHKINRGRFSDFDCRDTAYFYGLLLADGCLTGSTGNTLALSLKSTDGYMVDRFHS